MWLISLRDLQWRRRRFTVAVLATGLVFGMSLVMAGVVFTLHEEGRRIVRSFDADVWVVAADVSGPFTATTPLNGATIEQLAGGPGVQEAAPVVILHSTTAGDEPRDVNVIGQPPGSFVARPVAEGRQVERAGETVADRALGLAPGERLAVGGRQLTVVGIADGVTWYFGTPTLFVPLEDARSMAFGAQPLATAVAVQGSVDEPPSGSRVLAGDEVVADLERPLQSSTQTVSVLNGLLWVVAAGIIGSMVYLSALERSRDVAVLKATGATNRTLFGGLLLQAMVLAVTSALIATVVAVLIRPAIPFGVEIPVAAYVQLAIVVASVGLIASLAGLRRAVSVQPALAFGGA